MVTLEPHGIGAWEEGSEDSATARGIEVFEIKPKWERKKLDLFWGGLDSVCGAGPN